MLGENHRSPAAIARSQPTGTRGPRWRALLENQVAGPGGRGHRTVADLPQCRRGHPDGDGNGPAQQETQRLLRRAIAARRKLADVEKALGRLAAGNFGCCEQCGSAIPAGPLAIIPETRYCPRCDTGPARARDSAKRSASGSSGRCSSASG
jgi:RNA polymerase-binding transcription factor DksA